MTKLNHKHLVAYGFAILAIIPIISNPNLIDGISYFKVSLALILITPIIPIIFSSLALSAPKKISILLLILWTCICLIPLVIELNWYRSIFGSPGRHNGLISILNFTYFFAFGMYIRKHIQFENLLKSILSISACTSTVALFLTIFDIRNVRLFSALNLNNPDFRDNTNLIAPIISIGLVSGFLLWKKSRKRKFLLLIIPAVILSLRVFLVQIPLVLIISLLTYLVVPKARNKSKIFSIPIAVIGSYLSTLFFLNMGLLRIDTSTSERLAILKESLKLWKEFGLLPRNIDALSDYTSNFPGGLLLDDFHNVFLQLFFSFGLVALALFVFALLWSYTYLGESKSDQQGYITLQIAILVSLLLGIMSPNYFYLIATVIGFGITTKSLYGTPAKNSDRRYFRVLTFFVSALVTLPVIVQISDFQLRHEISSLTAKRGALGFLEISETQRLLYQTSRLRDTEYKFRVGKNLFNVDECADGNRVLDQLQNLNPKDVRIQLLVNLSDECDKRANRN